MACSFCKKISKGEKPILELSVAELNCTGSVLHDSDMKTIQRS